MNTIRIALVLGFLFAAALPPAAPAAERDATVVAQDDGPSLGEAIERVRRKHPGGRIVSAETQVRGNREVHVIKVLTRDGKVVTERVTGRSRGGRG